MNSIFDNSDIVTQEDDTDILTEEEIAAIMAEGRELMEQDIANGEYPDNWATWPTADYEREQSFMRAIRTIEGE